MAKWSKEQQDLYDRTTKRRYARVKKSARRLKKPCTITVEEYTMLIEGQNCHYCDGKLNETGGGLDRIDSKKGYTLKNVVACCYTCNTMKSSLDVSDFYKHLKRILEHATEFKKTIRRQV